MKQTFIFLALFSLLSSLASQADDKVIFSNSNGYSIKVKNEVTGSESSYNYLEVSFSQGSPLQSNYAQLSIKFSDKDPESSGATQSSDYFIVQNQVGLGTGGIFKGEWKLGKEYYLFDPYLCEGRTWVVRFISDVSIAILEYPMDRDGKIDYDHQKKSFILVTQDNNWRIREFINILDKAFSSGRFQVKSY